MTLSVPEFANVVAALAEKSLCLLNLPDCDTERPRWPMDGVPGIDDEGVTSPLFLPLPPAPAPLASRKMELMKSPTSPVGALLLGVDGPPEPLPGVV